MRGSYSIDFLNKNNTQARIQALSAFPEVFQKETDVHVALRMAYAVANLIFEDAEAFEMIAALDFKRPNIDALTSTPNDQTLDKTKQAIREICDWLQI